ncbi:enoyl-CoA hydratase-related protein [Sphingobium sp. YR768]|uniref:enoyl-CoA hydratase-related protein n=1 Tax=Sphingobium sp. YR768 TaxID=1884365 RepID=UPI0008B2223F|nr:enoyl-CoA hydratase-related protein [Sphingobium sp. YR768]SES15208.1 short chain enoyl-CoA hydratase [Sphingobium sp. YR768]
MSAELPLLLSETAATGVLVLQLNRPDKRNALATPLLAALADALDHAARDDAVRCVIVTGSDKIFAAGADINEMVERQVAGALSDVRPAFWRRIRGFQKPLVAAVEGWCLGAGNELLMCCDLSVAGRDARFGQPETNLGIMPGAGGTATLSRLVGRTAAMRMVLLGDPISADEAEALGLVALVVATGAARSAAVEMAERIAARAPLAMRQAKASINATFDLPHAAHLGFERQAFSALFGSDDKREGVAAFLDKRSANWTGS